MIQVEHLTKRYGSRKAVRDISFEVKQGEILGFLGPNGAGKSTTMNILTGYLSSTSGKVAINGLDIQEQPNQAKKTIGYLPEQPPLYPNMTVLEYLEFVYNLKKINLGGKGKQKKEKKFQHILEVCQRVQLDQVMDRLISNLSKGYKQRVGLAQAMLGNPEVLILDEPTVGLDPKQIIEIRSLIQQLGENHTIILSSHILSEIQAVCNRIIIINQGMIVADDTADHLTQALSDEKEYVIRVAGEEQRISQALESLDNIREILSCGSKEEGTCDFILHPETGAEIRFALFQLLAEQNLPLLELKDNALTLEEVFLKLIAQQPDLSEDDDEDENTTGEQQDSQVPQEGDLVLEEAKQEEQTSPLEEAEIKDKPENSKQQDGGEQ